MKNFTSLILMFASSSVLAGTVVIPNTFVSGTAAVASDVNDNFSAVAGGVNDNAANITINENNVSVNSSDINDNAIAIAALQTPSAQKSFRIVDVDDTDRGTLLSHHLHYIKLITDKGYIQTINLDGSLYIELDFGLSYTASDCTGIAYTQHVNGILFTNESSLYYTAMDAVPASIAINSTYSKDMFTGIYTCSTNSFTGDYYVANLNDFSITGATSAIGKNPFITVYK